MIRVLVISGICLYRDGLAGLFARRRKVQVIGTAADVAAANETGLTAEAPDVVLLDTTGVDVGRAVAALREALPGTPVVALTVPNREEELLTHVEAGVDGLVTVESSFAELVAAVECAARGEALWSPSVTTALIHRFAARALPGPEPAGVLTAREREIVGLIDSGLSNKQIAHRLRIELPTVKNHVHHILGKLGVRGRSEAAALLRAGRA